MSSVIHMETDQVRAVARQLSQASSDIQAEITSVCGRLRSINWQSPSRDRFISDVGELQRKFQTYTDLGTDLGLRVQREVDEWERVDNNTNDFHDLFSGFVGVGGLHIWEPHFNWPDQIPMPPFDWFKWGTDETKNWIDVINDYLKSSRITLEYHDWGKTINEFLGNAHGGGVGTMQDLGRFIKSPGFQWGLPLGMNTISGLIDDEGIGKAAVSGLIETGLQKGLEYLIPGTGTVMLINSGVQIIGNLGAAGLDMLGDHEGAVLLQNGMEALDLGGYVGDFSNEVTDMILPPWNDPPDFSNILERAEKITDLGKLFFR